MLNLKLAKGLNNIWKKILDVILHNYSGNETKLLGFASGILLETKDNSNPGSLVSVTLLNDAFSEYKCDDYFQMLDIDLNR